MNENAKRWRKYNPERAKEVSRDNMRKRILTGKQKEYMKKRINENREKHNRMIQNWRKTDNGRKYSFRHQKIPKRFIKILPNIFYDCRIDHHHIDKNAPFVIMIPRKIHLSASGNKEYHFEKNNEFIEKTYMINPDIFLGRF